MTRRCYPRRFLLPTVCAALIAALPLLPVVAHAAQPRTSHVAGSCVSHGQPGYLHTCGPYIEDAAGRQVRLQAVNWYGFESNDFVAAGLDRQTYQDIIATVKRLGYNTLRIPFSNEMVETNPVVSSLKRACPTGEPTSACRAVDGQALLGPNADLYGLTALQILKTIVDAAGAQGLYVILDDHRSRAGWGAQVDGLWYDTADGFPPSSFVADWQRLAFLFNGDQALTGVDLFNEPRSLGHPTTCAAYLSGHGASWGSCDGQSNPATDWRAAATLAGNAILQIDPNLLIVVEGTTMAPDSSGALDPSNWGTSLTAVGTQPVSLAVPGRLVYSVHDYWWQQGNADAATMAARWTHLFGYLTNPAAPYATPVWIGEFGTCDTSPSCIVDATPNQPGYWFDTFVRYLNTPTYPGAPPYGWSVWSLNGTSPDAYNYAKHVWVRREGDPEPYGLLNTTWTDSAIPEMQSELFDDLRLSVASTMSITDTAPITAPPTATPAPNSGAVSSAPWPPVAVTPAPTTPITITPGGATIPWKGISAPRNAPQSRYPLTAQLVAPRTATTGRLLRYVVVLTNTSATPVRFAAGCPIYNESLSISGGSIDEEYSAVEQRFALNCGAVTAIRPGASVTFAMAFAVPSWAAPGVQSLTWSFDGLANAAAQTSLTITQP